MGKDSNHNDNSYSTDRSSFGVSVSLRMRMFLSSGYREDTCGMRVTPASGKKARGGQK
jgi:hypothetical protein